ncbi:MAG: hypothetical protein WCW47_00725 [Candidatus Paceibacterota bacterium]|jgi:hypothetical protein
MRGGYRKNAGRKQGFSAKNAEEARRLLSARVSEEIGPISNVLISQAKKGNIRAIKELFDRAWGRPKQETEIGPNEINRKEVERLSEQLAGIISGVEITVRKEEKSLT